MTSAPRLRRSVAERLVGRTLEELTRDMGATWRYLVADSQLRWVGPEKGVIHLGLAAVVNALWDLWARHAGSRCGGSWRT